MAVSAERRSCARYPLSTGVNFYHEPSRRQFAGRGIDISSGGLLMYIPPNTPVQPGHVVRITVGGVNRPEFSGLSEKPLAATIVRVDRTGLIEKGHLAVGVKFNAV